MKKNSKISKLEREISQLKSNSKQNRGLITRIKSREDKVKQLEKDRDKLTNQRDNLFDFDKISGTGRQNYEYFEDLFR